MFRNTVSGMMLTLLLTSMLTIVFNIQPVGASGTIYIRADGSIDPSTAPISTVDNITYTLNADIISDADGIVVERNNVVVEGAGYAVQGKGVVDSKGISLFGRSNVTIKNTSISNFYYGVWLYESSNNNTIRGNSVTNNSAGVGGGARTGIYLERSSNNNINGNELTNNWIGILLREYSNLNNVSGNNVTNNNNGIELGWSSDNRVTGNNITNNLDEGMRLYVSSNNTVSGNSFINDGLLADGPFGDIVEHNFVNGKPLVYLEGRSNQTVDDAGQVILINCKYMQVKNLNLSHTTVGLELLNTNGTIISGNSITANSPHGISIYGSSNNNSISGNTIAGNNGSGIWIAGPFGGGCYNNIVGNSITANGRAGVELYSANNTMISGNNITENAVGVLGNSYNNMIDGNNISNSSDRGIYLTDSLYNHISGNIITNSGRDGIHLFYYSDHNSIDGNDIANNGGSIFGGSGIYLHESSNNSISRNTMTNNGNGIRLEESSNNNSMHGNTIADSKYGIYFEYSSNNSIYNNNFVNNVDQIYDFWAMFGEPSNNSWDDGYPSGGNCWSDYIGVDFYKGPYQNETGSDGIGDTPYSLDSNNTDNYPLMKPYPWNPHDLGITYIGNVWEPGCVIFPLKTVVGLGYILNINVFIMNYGTYPEVFNATVHVNTTVIRRITNVTLASRNSIILNFTGETSGLTYGNYLISAYATPVPGEIDTTDNNRTGGMVYIGIPGDLNGDGIVDIYDAILLGLCFSSTPDDPKWNPNADFNGDGLIDIFDAIVLASNFGKTS